MATSAQLRAARALLNWSVGDLAARAGVGREIVTRAETDATAPGPVQVVKALEAAGVEFIAEDGDGLGVRLRKPRTGPPSIAAEDLNASNDE
jgi:transcriptional regulator with XRE-family HTH domain